MHIEAHTHIYLADPNLFKGGVSINVEADCMDMDIGRGEDCIMVETKSIKMEIIPTTLHLTPTSVIKNGVNSVALSLCDPEFSKVFIDLVEEGMRDSFVGAEYALSDKDTLVAEWCEALKSVVEMYVNTLSNTLTSGTKVFQAWKKVIEDYINSKRAGFDGSKLVIENKPAIVADVFAFDADSTARPREAVYAPVNVVTDAIWFSVEKV